jgi:hypothetical protein
MYHDYHVMIQETRYQDDLRQAMGTRPEAREFEPARVGQTIPVRLARWVAQLVRSWRTGIESGEEHRKTCSIESPAQQCTARVQPVGGLK